MKTTPKRGKIKGFSEFEKSAMKDRVREMKADADGSAEGEKELRGKVAEMSPADRAIAERFHAIVRASAPSLAPRLWYGMPAYYQDGKLICHFQPAQKFKTRYATIGFSDAARMDDGTVWPVAYAVTQLTAAEEAKVVALLKKALGGGGGR